LKLHCDEQLSNFAFKFKLRQYNKGLSITVTELARQHKAGTLPAAKDNGAVLAIRWKAKGAPDSNLDLQTWLPIFVDGARESREMLRMVAAGALPTLVHFSAQPEPFQSLKMRPEYPHIITPRQHMPFHTLKSKHH
jgi:hypothetical protein